MAAGDRAKRSPNRRPVAFRDVLWLLALVVTDQAVMVVVALETRQPEWVIASLLGALAPLVQTIRLVVRAAMNAGQASGAKPGTW